ncbi:MAG: ABC1 kinase family protein, partial [Acidimicrobiales bacterium]
MAVATDLDAGSYSDSPPWTLDDPAALAWRRDLADVRARVVAEVPLLTRPGRWPPGRRVLTVTRRLGAALSLWALREKRSGVPEVRRAGISRRLRVAAEGLGPTYIKLGQIISSGEG